MQNQKQVETSIGKLWSKVNEIADKGEKVIPTTNHARDWFIVSMDQIKDLVTECIEENASLSKKAGKQRVSLMFGYGSVKLLVNGKEIDVPDYVGDDDDDKPRVPLQKILNQFGEDHSSLLSGEKVLDEREVKQLAERLGCYWDEIYDVLDVD